MTKKRRREEGKTDYRKRVKLLKGEKARIVFRKTNKYIIGQCIKSKEAQDYVVTGVNSIDLLDYGWPENRRGSLKSLPSCYLTGFLLGKKILDKEEKEAVFDIGLIRSIPKSRAYAFLKGIVDSGVKMKCKEEIFPDESRIRGRHLKSIIPEIFDKIKKNIELKFV